MFRKLQLLACCSVITAPFWIPTAAKGACAMTVPEHVLSCLETTLSTRDIATLGDLIAPDFVFRSGTGQSWGREDELRSTGAMFESPKVERIELRISEPTVVPGTEPGTWQLEDVETELTVHALDEQGISQEYTVRQEQVRFGVRATEDGLGFQIFLWETPKP